MSQCEALGSFAGFVDRAGIRNTKTGRASETLGRKSLIINVQISHRPPKSSGNVRFCTACTGPIRGNPNLRAENPNRNTRVNGTATPLPNRPNRCTVLQCVAACFAQKFFRPQVQHVHPRTLPRPRNTTAPPRQIPALQVNQAKWRRPLICLPNAPAAD